MSNIYCSVVGHADEEADLQDPDGHLARGHPRQGEEGTGGEEVVLRL